MCKCVGGSRGVGIASYIALQQRARERRRSNYDNEWQRRCQCASVTTPTSCGVTSAPCPTAASVSVSASAREIERCAVRRRPLAAELAATPCGSLLLLARRCKRAPSPPPPPTWKASIGYQLTPPPPPPARKCGGGWWKVQPGEIHDFPRQSAIRLAASHCALQVGGIYIRIYIYIQYYIHAYCCIWTTKNNIDRYCYCCVVVVYVIESAINFRVILLLFSLLRV